MAERYLREQIDEWFERDYRETFMERIERLLESETLFAGEEGAIQYGHTLEHILSGISVVLRENERIAGAVKMRIPTKEEEEHITAVYRKWWDMPTKERHKKILFYYSEGWLKCRRSADWMRSVMKTRRHFLPAQSSVTRRLSVSSDGMRQRPDVWGEQSLRLT